MDRMNRAFFPLLDMYWDFLEIVAACCLQGVVGECFTRGVAVARRWKVTNNDYATTNHKIRVLGQLK